MEDEEWTRHFEVPPPIEKDYGARVVITCDNGEILVDEIAVADSHPRGARPFSRPGYLRKFRVLSEDILDHAEGERFPEQAQQATGLAPGYLDGLNLTIPASRLEQAERNGRGIF